MSENRDIEAYHECRVCQSDDPNTIHGKFLKGLCKPCSHLVSKRALATGETVDEAVRHFRPRGHQHGGGAPR